MVFLLFVFFSFKLKIQSHVKEEEGFISLNFGML